MDIQHGFALYREGRVEDAARVYELILRNEPDNGAALTQLSGLRLIQGDAAAAEALLRQAIAVSPEPAEAHYGLGLLLVQFGRIDEAIQQLRAAVTADADFAEADYELGRLLVQRGATEDAIACLQRALDVAPDYVEARLALAGALLRLRCDDAAMAAFHTVLAAEPDHPDAHIGLGMLLDHRHLHAKALEHYRHVLAGDADHSQALGLLANSLRNMGHYAEALPVARRLVAMQPDCSSAANLLGRILAETGALDEAEMECRRAVALAPDQPRYHYSLGQLVRIRPEDNTIPQLEEALARIASFPRDEQCLLHFALAKAYTDIGAPERGFTHTLQGNAIARSGIVYDQTAQLHFMDRIRHVFSTELLASRLGQGCASNVPIFIVGMPRSGTTLVEQILASHSSVFGAGERSDLQTTLLQVSAARLGAATFPEAVWTMRPDELHELGASYLAALQSLAPQAERITDKLPNNFNFVGMIHLILPNARIIHVMRDPVDTCLSCFCAVFGTNQPFTFDLAELGRYHRAYQQMMAHWRTILPPKTMLEVQYESLVDDLVTQAHRIMDYCGLDWQASCLEFYRTVRPIPTASMIQVRQPIYRSSVGRWRPEAAVLRPLLEVLAEDADADLDRAAGLIRA